jgi:hypothetical protein
LFRLAFPVARLHLPLPVFRQVQQVQQARRAELVRQVPPAQRARPEVLALAVPSARQVRRATLAQLALQAPQALPGLRASRVLLGLLLPVQPVQQAPLALRVLQAQLVLPLPAQLAQPALPPPL